MLQNEYVDAKIGVDPAENEPSKVASVRRVEAAQAKVCWPQVERYVSRLGSREHEIPDEHDFRSGWSVLDTDL